MKPTRFVDIPLALQQNCPRNTWELALSKWSSPQLYPHSKNFQATLQFVFEFLTPKSRHLLSVLCCRLCLSSEYLPVHGNSPNHITALHWLDWFSSRFFRSGLLRFCSWYCYYTWHSSAQQLSSNDFHLSRTIPRSKMKKKIRKLNF